MESLLIVSLHDPFTIWTNHMMDWVLVAATTVTWQASDAGNGLQTIPLIGRAWEP